jgi:predicted ATPase
MENPEPNLTYSFQSTLVRDVVYDLMLFSQRKEIHKRLIQIYQTEYPGELIEKFNNAE